MPHDNTDITPVVDPPWIGHDRGGKLLTSFGSRAWRLTPGLAKVSRAEIRFGYESASQTSGPSGALAAYSISAPSPCSAAWRAHAFAGPGSRGRSNVSLLSVKEG